MLSRAMFLIGISLLGACSGSQQAATPAGTKSLAGIEKIAEEACLCSMAGEGPECWDEFNSRVEGVPHTGYGTSSLPMTSEISCFGAGEEVCLATRYSLVGGAEDDFVCTVEQADELERLWNSKIPADGGSPTVADEAVEQRIAEMHEEARRAETG